MIKQMKRLPIIKNKIIMPAYKEKKLANRSINLQVNSIKETIMKVTMIMLMIISRLILLQQLVKACRDLNSWNNTQTLKIKIMK